MSDDAQTAGMGHNRPSLADRIFAESDASVAAVLEAVRDRIRSERTTTVDALSRRAKALAANTKRLPAQLDDETAGAVLDLLAEIGAHSESAAEEKAEVTAAAKAVTDALTGDCKPMEAGIAGLEKALRPLLENHIVACIAAYNATLPDGHEPLATLTIRGPSGARASVAMASTNVVVDAEAVPRSLCVPDQNLIDTAMERDGQVPGVEVRRTPSLRMYKQ